MHQNLTELYHKYGVKRFFFCDDAMPPANMMRIAQLVNDKLHDVTWEAEARFEKTLNLEFLSTLKKGGCRLLIFGLESASQRVLDLMNKNNIVENDMKILEACSVNGIAVNLQTFIGFPTETREEAWKTIDFLIDNEQYIASMGFGTFTLLNDTPVYRNPQHYNISNISISSKENLLHRYFDYVPLSGMTLEDIKTEYNVAKEKLDLIYATRCDYLTAALGPHGLLHFSHYGYSEIRQIWKRMDEVKDTYDYIGSTDLNDLVLTMSSTLLYSCPSDQEFNFKRLIICTQTGAQFSLSTWEQKLLELFDGKRPVSEITSLWVKEQCQELDGQILLLVDAFTIIKEFIRNGLVVVSTDILPEVI